jgi:pyridoxal phosphate enzyme (YggS family)
MTEESRRCERLEEIQARLEKACTRAGRKASEVLLIGASKTVAAEKVEGFLQCGLKHIGENYVIEGVRKIEVLAARNTRVQWHFIGALQSNKAREGVQHFDFIHSVDRPSLVAALDKAAKAEDKIQNVLIQVNLGAEESKAGCTPENVSALAAQIAQSENLKLCGLMCLPPFHENPEEMRPYFRALRELRDGRLAPWGDASTLHLSMGMSNDFEIAIEEGATMIRVGTALFGRRKIEENFNEKSN